MRRMRRPLKRGATSGHRLFDAPCRAAMVPYAVSWVQSKPSKWLREQPRTPSGASQVLSRLPPNTLPAAIAPSFRAPRGRVLVVSLLAVVVTTALMAGTTSLAAWGAIRFLSGLASAGVFVLASGIVLDAPRRQGRASLSGMLFSGVGMGIALSGAVVRVAGGALGWRGEWLTLALLAAVTIVPAWRWLLLAHNGAAPPPPGQPLPERGARGAGPAPGSVSPRRDGLHRDRDVSGGYRRPGARASVPTFDFRLIDVPLEHLIVARLTEDDEGHVREVGPHRLLTQGEARLLRRLVAFAVVAAQAGRHAVLPGGLSPA